MEEKDKEFAVGIKFEVVVHATGVSKEEAMEQALADKEYLGMLMAKASPEVTFCEEQ